VKRKRWVLGAAILLSAFLPVCELQASGFGVTLSTNTFAPLARAGAAAVSPGLYGRGGLAWLPGGHLEIEIYHLPQLTPRFYSEVFFGLSAGYWLLERKRTSYLNFIADAGLLYGLDGTLLLNLKLCPFVFGCPAYRYAERFLTVGVIYDVQRNRAFLQMQLLAVTLYL